MRSLTAAQNRELTSDAQVVFLFESDNLNYSSRFVNDLDTAYYDVGFEVDDIEEDINWFGGFGANTAITCRVNNVDAFLDYIENAGTRLYVENDECAVSIKVNYTKHTLYKGVFSNWTINQENVEFDITDENDKWNVDILTEVTKENYPAAPDESFGCYVPLLYCGTPNGNEWWKVPTICVQKGYVQMGIARHPITNFQLGPGAIPYIFNSEIDTYIPIINLVGTHSTSASELSWVSFLDGDGDLTLYYRYSIGRQGDEIADIGDINNIYVAGTDASCHVAGNETLSLILDINNLGLIYATNGLSLGISCNWFGSPNIAMVNAITGGIISSSSLSAGLYTWDGYDDAGELWTFDNIRDREFQIICGSTANVDIFSINFNVRFALYDKNARRVQLGRLKTKVKRMFTGLKSKFGGGGNRLR